jgi:type I restriction enzyme S subunit
MSKVKLQEISKSISSGLTPLRSNSAYWENGSIPWVKTDQLGEKYIYDSNEKISSYALQDTSIKLNPVNTLSIAMYGEGRTRGNVSILKSEMTTNQASCNLVIDENKADHEFVYYFLKTQYNQLRNLSSGVRNNLNSNDIKNFEIRLPKNIATQKKIAAVLSALDAKIELNNRINAELESLAKTIYDYWFVQFDFPNSDGKPYKSSGGEMVYHPELKRKIPESWKVVPISELMDVKDGTHDSPKPTESGFHLITSKHLLKNGIDFASAYFISKEDYNNVNKRSKVESNDILISMIGTIGETYFVKESSINFAIKNIGLFKTSQSVKLAEYVYLYINSFYGKQYFTSNISGSIQNYLTLGVLRNIPLIIPRDEILDLFIMKVKPIYQKIYLGNLENQQLTQLRDWLLPMLMNGQVSIK